MINSILAVLPDGLSGLSEYVQTIIAVILWGITSIGAIIIIAIGFQMMTAQQAEERQKLKSRMIWFAIGTGVVCLASTIWTILQSIYA